MKTLATCPILPVRSVGLQSMRFPPRTLRPMIGMWIPLQKFQAILIGAGQWRLAFPPYCFGMNVNRTKRNQFHQKIKKMASINEAPENRYHPGKPLSS